MADHTITLYTIYQEDDKGNRQTSIRGDQTVTVSTPLAEHSLHKEVASGSVESTTLWDFNGGTDAAAAIVGDNIDTLFIFADGDITVSINDVSTGTPTFSYVLSTESYVIWHNLMLGVTNPWDSQTINDIYFKNTSGSTVNVSMLCLEAAP